jgi:uncharacterized protein YbbC (DUF1343 family)
MKNFKIIIITLLFFLNTALAKHTSILYGIDRLKEDTFAKVLENKNLAVLTHAAGVNQNQEHLIDILFKNYRLIKIFAPEHGLRTLEDDWIDDGIDETTGLPVLSLYKRKTKAPDPKDLIDVDAIVIDLQDVGVRYYTYFSTLAEVMKVAAKLNVEIILLDRPNLLGGNIVEGKVLDEFLTGNFTAYHNIPTRHGMTLGELSLMINQEKQWNCKLIIIPVHGWTRESLILNQSRPWISPSPALVLQKQVGFYAYVGLLENFNLAVGRGQKNDNAFQIFGAPWITHEESLELSQKLNQLNFSGIFFEPYNWFVDRAIFNGQWAFGIKMKIENELYFENIRSDEFIFKITSLLSIFFKERLKTNNSAALAFGSLSMLNAIKENIPWEKYQAEIEKELSTFKLRRDQFLMY